MTSIFFLSIIFEIYNFEYITNPLDYRIRKLKLFIYLFFLYFQLWYRAHIFCLLEWGLQRLLNNKKLFELLLLFFLKKNGNSKWELLGIKKVFFLCQRTGPPEGDYSVIKNYSGMLDFQTIFWRFFVVMWNVLFSIIFTLKKIKLLVSQIMFLGLYLWIYQYSMDLFGILYKKV